MHAVLLIGHGSLRPDSGTAMMQIAAQANALGVAPLVSACFLNYSHPGFAQEVDRSIARGATDITVMPYFLVPGKFVSVDVPQAVEAVRQEHPEINFTLARCFDDHPALADLVLKRAAATEISHRDETLAAKTGLLIVAHGSTDPASNRPIYCIAEHVRAANRYAAVTVCFLGLNEPSIPEAIDDFIVRGLRRIVAVPYFLQLGGHVAEDLPAIVADVQAAHPTSEIVLAEYLAYDPLLLRAIADRVEEAVEID